MEKILFSVEKPIEVCLTFLPLKSRNRAKESLCDGQGGHQ